MHRGQVLENLIHSSLIGMRRRCRLQGGFVYNTMTHLSNEEGDVFCRAWVVDPYT